MDRRILRGPRGAAGEDGIRGCPAPEVPLDHVWESGLDDHATKPKSTDQRHFPPEPVTALGQGGDQVRQGFPLDPYVLGQVFNGVIAHTQGAILNPEVRENEAVLLPGVANDGQLGWIEFHGLRLPWR